MTETKLSKNTELHELKWAHKTVLKRITQVCATFSAWYLVNSDANLQKEGNSCSPVTSLSLVEHAARHVAQGPHVVADSPFLAGKFSLRVALEHSASGAAIHWFEGLDVRVNGCFYLWPPRTAMASCHARHQDNIWDNTDCLINLCLL